MGLRSRAFLAGGLGFAAAFVVACGGSGGLLSGEQSSTLSSQLDAASAAVSSGNCRAATSAADAFNSSVGSLPPSVSPKLVQNLGDGAVTIKQLAVQDCSSSSSTSSSSTTTSSTQSTPTTTATVTSTATQSSTASTQTNPATNTTPPGTSTTTNGGASLGTGTSGNGNGNGNGNGGTGQ
jgi:hypothetical protein